jgi:hypothetical protein
MLSVEFRAFNKCFNSVGPAVVHNIGQPFDNINPMITLSVITLSGLYSTRILIKYKNNCSLSFN